MKKLLTGILMLLSVLVAEAQQVIHTVLRGETLESIAQKYHVTKDVIVSNNPDVAEVFYVGLKLNIPESTTTERKLFTQQEPTTNETNSPASTSETVTEKKYPTNIEKSDSKKNTWHFAFRLGPSFFKGEKSSSGKGTNRTFTSSSSIGYEAALGAHYYFLENFYGSAMLGYYATYFSSVGTYYGSTTSVSSESKNIQLPIEIGFVLPISKLIGLVLEAGPSFLYAVDGYVKTNGEKKSFSEIEKDSKIDRFSVLLKLGGGLKFGGFRVQGFYGIPLTKVQGGEKKGFWGITLGAEF